MLRPWQPRGYISTYFMKSQRAIRQNHPGFTGWGLEAWSLLLTLFLVSPPLKSPRHYSELLWPLLSLLLQLFIIYQNIALYSMGKKKYLSWFLTLIYYNLWLTYIIPILSPRSLALKVTPLSHLVFMIWSQVMWSPQESYFKYQGD